MEFKNLQQPLSSVARAPREQVSLLTQLFERAKHGPLRVSLRDSRGLFVSAQTLGGAVIANREALGPWETFELLF